ncbi:phosphotransferase [Brachybacterium sp. NBEC-018]|uniref:phosphotransferase n=1 Tax=Brachybacterium sp. NBEC-018 TaxID=2996004 RepID=UPI002174D9E9|nr:phosphotransferase [Brachybacterium sp. NBEC-018]UVY83551.1 phosphotransferase [Brachybacterium sp. NBEC-018]
MEPEIPLAGGNASAGVVRVGDTVRKPWTSHSPGVLALMGTLRDRGVDLPAPLGQDEQGRMVTEYVPGALAMDSPALTRAQLAEVGAMVRGIHDACAGLSAQELGLGPALIPVPDADLVCHGDLTPWNLVLGPRWVFIDWDGAASSTRAWDLAYSAQAFTLNDVTADPHHAAEDLRAFVLGIGDGADGADGTDGRTGRGYDADAALRAELAALLPRRAQAMHDHLERAHRSGWEPWGSMFLEGHGAHWAGVAAHLERHEELWRDALCS